VPQQRTREQSAKRVTVTGIIIGLFLTAGKFVVAFAGNSSAMFADAVHSLSDFATDFVVIVGVMLGARPRDATHRYGHGKVETLSAGIIGLVLFAVAIGIFINGADTIIRTLGGEEELAPPGLIAFFAAVATLVIKEWLYHYTMRVGNSIKSEVIRANAWHHRSDALSSIGTGVGIGGAILLGGEWAILDPLAAVIVSFFIFWVAWKIAARSVNELLEGSLPKNEEDELRALVRKVEGCSGAHEIKARMVGNALVVDMHLYVDGELSVRDGHTVATRVEKALKKKYGRNTITTVHVEPRKQGEK
jgi:cation diffusion facilitator family transporter